MEALGTLAGGIAHNFNNLLMGIMGNASLMLYETDRNSRNYERLENIERLVDSGSKLTRQLLGYAREGRYEVRPLSLNQLVKETSDTFGTAKKEIRVHQELAEDLWGIKADQGQIEQALLNLYVNAADAMPAGGDLFVKTANVAYRDIRGKEFRPRPGNYVMATVADTGVGMDKETRERIFDPFFTTKGLSKGTGLGLSSVYGTIKAHGGYIEVDSKKGKGTSFKIYLPAAEIELHKEARSPEEALRGAETVLLIDDEGMILGVGSEILEKMGYQTLLARGGKEAIEVYRNAREEIDIVILDMIMPDMGGKETYAALKKINPDIKVLLSSGYSIDGQASEILEQGCDGFIQKPFKIRQLSQKIREILDRK
jgi:CheY-like chemotaxis protein